MHILLVVTKIKFHNLNIIDLLWEEYRKFKGVKKVENVEGLDKVSIIINILAVYLGVEVKEINNKLKKKENRYLLLLLLERYNCLNGENVKDLLEIISDKSMKYNIGKAQEKFLVNKKFRERYLEIQEGLNKII